MKEIADKQTISQELEEAYRKDATRSKKGRIRELFDEIEEKKAGGMSYKNILAVLNHTSDGKEGIGLSFASFRQYISQIREERGNNIAADEEPKEKKVVGKKTAKKTKVLQQNQTGSAANVSAAKATPESEVENPVRELKKADLVSMAVIPELENGKNKFRKSDRS